MNFLIVAVMFATGYSLTKIGKMEFVFTSIKTTVHELSHVLVGIVCGAKNMSIKVMANSNGEMSYYCQDENKKKLILMSGYLGSSLVTLLTFYLFIEGKHSAIIIFYLALIAFAKFFLVKNEEARKMMTWQIIVMGISLIVFPKFLIILTFVITAIMMSEDVYLTYSQYIRAKNNEKRGSDAEVLGEKTKISKEKWALGFLTVAIICSVIIPITMN